MYEIITILLSLTSKMGYWGIVILMTVESSFVPFPSEVVIPPAAYLASIGEMNIYLIIFFGVIGSLLGSTLNYFLALFLGRKIIFSFTKTKIAKMLFITEEKIKISEDYFLRYGVLSTFMGRLVPAVRQLISIPAGFSKMNFKKFILFTFLGSGTWTIILAVLGYFFGANREMLAKYYRETSLFFIGIVIFIAVGIILFKRRKKSE